MDAEIVARLTTAAGIVLGGGAVLAPFVSYGVNVAKRMIGRAGARRAVLPALGLLLGWVVTALVLTIVRLEWTGETIALAVLTGYAASAAADAANAKAKEASRRE